MGNAARDAGERVAVAAQRYGLPDCVLEIPGFADAVIACGTVPWQDTSKAYVGRISASDLDRS